MYGGEEWEQIRPKWAMPLEIESCILDKLIANTLNDRILKSTDIQDSKGKQHNKPLVTYKGLSISLGYQKTNNGELYRILSNFSWIVWEFYTQTSIGN